MASKTLYFDIIGRDKSGSAAVQKVGQELLLFGAAAGAAVGLAVKKFADFDAQMSQVKTLSHATGAEMSQLRDAALNLGQGIGFTATQVADAETELVKAGVSVKDQLGGGLVGTLNLAAAGQLDVADATQIAASAMTQFKLSGKDVPHIADLLAAGADKALGSVDDLGQGLSFVGPVANSMGVSLEQTVGTLALFAQNGILGEKAGTGLRGVLLSLTSPSKMASDVMKQYGINLYDATGKFIGIDGAAQQLKDHLGGLDQATRNQAMGQIFGNQQITQATILMNGGSKAVDKWTKSVNDQGFAAEQARGKMDNLNGDIKKLGAATDTALIKSGSAANDVLRGLTKSATDLVTGFANAPEPVQQTALALGAVTAGVALFGGGLLVLIPKIEATRMALRRMQADGVGLGKVLGKGGAIGLGITAAVVGFDLLDGWFSNIEASSAQMTNSVKTSATALDLMKTASKGMDTKWWTDVKTDAGSVKDALESAANSSTNFFDAMSQTASQKAILDTFSQIGKGLASLTTTDLPQAQSQFASLTKHYALNATAQWRLINQMPEYKDALTSIASQQGITANKTNILALAQGQQTQASEGAEDAAHATSKALAGLAGTADDTTTNIDDLTSAINDFGKGALDVDSASRAYQQAIDDMSDSIEQNGQTLDLNTQQGRDNDAALSGIAQTTLGLVSAQAAANATSDTLTQSMATGRQAFIDAATAAGLTADQANALADQYGLIPANVNTAIGLTGADTASSMVDGWISKLNDIPGGIITSVGIATTGLPDWATRAGGGDLDAAPGPKGVDSMLFKGARGEHVLTASDVDAMGGQNAVYAFRRQLHGARAQAAAIGTVSSTYAPMPIPVPVYAPGSGSSTAAGAASTVVEVRVTQKVSGPSLSDLIQMEIKTADGWQSLELESGVGR